MKTALVIDDNKTLADSLCQFLELLDVHATAAYSPRGMYLLLRDQTPDIVFLDINMPGLSGFEVLCFLKREWRLKDIPVVFVTSDDQKQTAERARHDGALALLVKPVTLEELENVLRQAKVIE